jgi:O-antigen ligase
MATGNLTASQAATLDDADIGRRKANAVTLLTVYLVLLMAVPSRLVFAPLGGAGAPSTILGAIFLVWFMLNWLHPSSPIGSQAQPVRRAAAVLLCAVLASYVASNQHSMITEALNGADRSLILVCGWLGALLLAADGIDSMGRLKTLIRRMVLGATCMGVLGIAQFLTGFNAARYITIPGLTSQAPYTDIQRASFNRPSATAIHPIEFGFVLAAILPLAINQARHAPPERRVRHWLQVLIIAGTLPMTVSRSAILGLAVGLIVILPTWPRRERWVAYLAIILGACGLFATVHGLLGTLKGLFLAVGSDSSTVSRTSAFLHSAPLIAARPWFGLGFGAFIPQTYFYTDNQYLNSLIEIGIIGFLALLGLFVTGWWTGRAARRRAVEPEIRDLAQSLTASVAVALVTFATFDALYFPMAAALTFLLLGCVGAVWRLAVGRAADVTTARATTLGQAFR